MRLHRLWPLLIPTVASAADVELTHQGRLTDPLGAPYEGPLGIEVSVWNHPTNTDVLTHRTYAESFPGEMISNGYYSVILGASGGLEDSDLDGPTWLQVTVGTTVLLPRQRITSVPRAATGNFDMSLFDGVKRDCPSGGEQTFNGTTGTWGECPTIGTQGDPGASCTAIRDAGVGINGMYWVDLDGAGSRPAREVYCLMDDVLGGGWMLTVHVKNASSPVSFMGLAFPDCVDDQTHCAELGFLQTGEMEELLVYDRVNQNKWAVTTRTSGASVLLDYLINGSGWGVTPYYSWTYSDGVTRTAMSHMANDGYMIDTSPWNNCTADGVSNVGTTCLACLRSDNYCGGQGKDTLFYMR